MFRYVLAHAGEHPALALAQAPAGLCSPREEAILAGLTFLPRRRKWLLGRWAAKRLLGELAAEDNGLVTGFIGKPGSHEDWRCQFSILNDEAGVPYVDREGQGRLSLSLSISHRGDWGLAAVALVARGPHRRRSGNRGTAGSGPGAPVFQCKRSRSRGQGCWPRRRADNRAHLERQRGGAQGHGHRASSRHARHRGGRRDRRAPGRGGSLAGARHSTGTCLGSANSRRVHSLCSGATSTRMSSQWRC